VVPRGCQGRHYDDAAVMLVLIGVIYGSKRGTGTPTFGLRGTVPLTFQDKMVKNLFSTEAGAASQAPLGELMTLSQTPESDEEGYFSSRLGTQGRFILLLNWYSNFLDQSYAPVRSSWQRC